MVLGVEGTKGMITGNPIEIVGGRDDVGSRAFLRALLPKYYQAIGTGIRQGAQKNGIYDAEYRCIRADTQG